MELISKLGIDWKLLVAQVINFLILLFVLKKFVFGPVLAKLEQRKGMIAKSVNDAKHAEDTLKDMETSRAQMLAATKKRTLEMLEEAANAAEKTKNSIVEAARAEAQAIFDQGKLQIAREKEKMLKEASDELGLMVVRAAEKIIEREFSPEDQKRLVSSAVEQFKK
jgi:F-type H+-transporting ATPase subunit b